MRLSIVHFYRKLDAAATTAPAPANPPKTKMVMSFATIRDGWGNSDSKNAVIVSAVSSGFSKCGTWPHSSIQRSCAFGSVSINCTASASEIGFLATVKVSSVSAYLRSELVSIQNSILPAPQHQRGRFNRRHLF